VAWVLEALVALVDWVLEAAVVEAVVVGWALEAVVDWVLEAVVDWVLEAAAAAVAVVAAVAPTVARHPLRTPADMSHIPYRRLMPVHHMVARPHYELIATLNPHMDRSGRLQLQTAKSILTGRRLSGDPS
jgi:hypothetical protein